MEMVTGKEMEMVKGKGVKDNIQLIYKSEGRFQATFFSEEFFRNDQCPVRGDTF